MLEIIKNAFELTKKNALVLIGVLLTTFLISFFFSFIIGAFQSMPFVSFILNMCSLIFQLYFGVGIMKLMLNIVDGKEPEFSEIKPTWSEMVKYLSVGLLLFLIFMVTFMITIGVFGLINVLKPGLSTFLSDLVKNPDNLVNYSKQEILYAIVVFMLLAIPSVLFYMRLQFASYLVIDKKLDLGVSINHSFKITKGYLLYIVLMLFAVVLLNILGVIALFIGLLFTIPMSMLIFILLYRSLEQTYLESHPENIPVE